MSTQPMRKIAEVTPHITPATADTVSIIKPITASIDTTNKPLRDCVLSAFKNYYNHLDGSEPNDVMELFESQAKAAAIEATMNYTRGNQSKAAKVLGISRGTLRKLLKKYDLV
jgi:Fis family transcriptional regulator